jgi:hypothetical protein
MKLKEIELRLKLIVCNSSMLESSAAFVFFALLAFVALHPIKAMPDIVTFIGGDVFHTTWTFNRNIFNVLSLRSPFNPSIMFPDAYSSFYSELIIGDTLFYAVAYLFSGSDTVSYVFVYFCSIVLSSLFAYKTARFLGAQPASSGVAGIAIGFSSYHYWQIGHVQILTLFWVLAPAYLIMTYLADGRRGRLYCLLALSVPLFAGPSYNLVTFGFFTAAILLASFLHMPRNSEMWKRASLICCTFAAAIVVNIPIWHEYFILYKMGNIRDAAHNDMYKVDLAWFAIPSNMSALYGPFQARMASIFKMQPHTNGLFPGFATLAFLALSLSAVKRIRASSIDTVRLAALRALVVLAFFLLLLSLGLVISWNGHRIAPNYVFKLVALTPFLKATRYIAHFSYPAMCAAAIAAAVVLSRTCKGRWEVVIASVLGLAIMIETDPVFSTSNRSVDPPPPAVYEFLATLEPGAGVIFLPFPDRIDGSDPVFNHQFDYMRYAHLHSLWMANGTTGFFPSSYVKAVSSFRLFPSPSAYQWISDTGLKYIVLDRGAPNFDRLQRAEFNFDCAALKTVYDDAGYAVLRVDARTLPACATTARRYELGSSINFKSEARNPFLVSGWSSPEPWGTWSEGRRAKLELMSTNLPDGPLTLSILAHVFGRGDEGRRIGVVVNGNAVGDLVFDHVNATERKSIEIPSQAVGASSVLDIEFLIPSPISPKELRMSDDSRMLGMGVIEAQISWPRPDR